MIIITLEQLQVVITAQTAGLRSELGRVNTQLGSVKKQATKSADGISKAFRKAARVIAAIGIGKIVKDSFTEAAQVNTNIENLSKMLGENSVEFMNWANGQAKSFGIAKKEAMSYGMTFANLVSGFSGGTAQTTQITTQLLQTSSVIASKTGRSMEDVMERIRSGMLGNTEAVEDLGIYASASALQQTQAYKTMANGTPWNKLDYYTKQQIITFGLLEQASVKYGNTMSGGLTSQLLVFRAELSNLKVALGQAFVPIVTAILPYLMTLIKHIQVAMSYVVAFVQLLFGVETATENSEKLANTAQEASDYLGSSAGNAGLAADNLGVAAKNAKKLKGELTGFDEINKLNMDDGSGAGAGADVSIPSPTGIGSSIEPPTFDKNLTDSVKTFNEHVDEAKKKLEDFKKKFENWLPVIIAVGAVLAGLWVVANLEKLAAGFALVAESLLTLGVKFPLLGSLSRKLAGTFETISGAIYNLLGKFGLVSSGLSDVTAMSAGTVATIAIVIAVIVAALVDLWRTSETFRTFILGAFATAWGILSSAMITLWTTGIQPLIEQLKILFGHLYDLYEVTLKPIIAIIAVLITWIVSLAVGTIGGILIGAINVVVSTIAIAVGAINNFIEAFKQGEIWAAALGVALTALAIGPITALITSLWGMVTALGATILGFIKSAAQAVAYTAKLILTNTWTLVVKAAQMAYNIVMLAFNLIMSANPLALIVIAIVAVVAAIVVAYNKFEWFRNGVVAVVDVVKSAFKGLGGIVIEIINFMIRGLNKFNIKVPDWVPAIGGKNFGFNIPEIPRLARGGIVDSAQMFIAGEAGKEVVMPLENNTGWITQLAEKVSTRMPQGPSNDRPIELTVKIGETTIGKLAIDGINALTKMNGSSGLII